MINTKLLEQINQETIKEFSEIVRQVVRDEVKKLKDEILDLVQVARETQPQWYEVKDIAELAFCSESKVRKQIREGVIKGAKATKGKDRWLIHRDEYNRVELLIAEKGLGYWRSYTSCQ